MRHDAGPRFPVAAACLFALIAIPTALQFVFPQLLPLLERNWPLILQGQVWRLVTSLCVQDSGWSGALFNLVNLALLGLFAERLWGGTRFALLFLVSGVATIALAYFWQPVGGGNSVANFGVAAATAVLALRRSKGAVARYVAMAVLAAGVVLLLMQDIHGIAVAIGGGLGYVLGKRTRLGEADTTG